MRRTEALNKVIGETLIDTIITFDGQGSILSVNPAVKSMFGYQPDELIGQNVSKLFLKVMEDKGDSSPNIFLSLTEKRNRKSD